MPLAADIGALADGQNHEAGKHHCFQNKLQLSAKKPIVALVHGGRVVSHRSDTQPTYNIHAVNEYII